MKYKGRERRNHIRIGMSLLVSYTVLDAPQEHKGLIAKDISGGGMRLPLKEKLAVGTLLKMQLELLKEKKKILFDVKVAWVKSVSRNKEYPYEAGVEFVNIDFAKRTMISNCAQYLNREELLKGFFR